MAEQNRPQLSEAVLQALPDAIGHSLRERRRGPLAGSPPLDDPETRRTEVTLIKAARIDDFKFVKYIARRPASLLLQVRSTMKDFHLPDKIYTLLVLLPAEYAADCSESEVARYYRIMHGAKLNQWLPAHPNMQYELVRFRDAIPKWMLPLFHDKVRAKCAANSTIATTSTSDEGKAEEKEKAMTGTQSCIKPFYFVYDYHPRSLEQYLKEHPTPLPWPKVLHLCSGLLAATEVMEAHGVLNLGCHTQNVLVSAFGEPVVRNLGHGVLFDDQQRNVTTAPRPVSREYVRSSRRRLAKITDELEAAAHGEDGSITIGSADWVKGDANERLLPLNGDGTAVCETQAPGTQNRPLPTRATYFQRETPHSLIQLKQSKVRAHVALTDESPSHTPWPNQAVPVHYSRRLSCLSGRPLSCTA